MEEFELSLQLFSKLLPAYFSLSLDIIYGQRNVGIRHIELMNILHKLRNQTKSSEKPGPEEWSDEDMRIISKFFSYELDVYMMFLKHLKQFSNSYFKNFKNFLFFRSTNFLEQDQNFTSS